MLVLDEATSALDAATEAAVVDALDRLAGTRTILMIAHRPSALCHADVVHVLDESRLVRSDRPAAA